VYPAYQQPVKYNLAVAREVLKHVYTAERLRPPTSFGAVSGTYGTLWGRARSLGYWREVVRSGEYARIGVYALEAYGIFKVRFVFFTPVFPSLSRRTWSDRVTTRGRLERLWGVGHSSGITWSRARRLGHRARSEYTPLSVAPPLRVGPIKVNNIFSFAYVLFGFGKRTLGALFRGGAYNNSLYPISSWTSNN